VIQALVGLADDDLEALIYHQRYLVLNPGKQDAPSDDLIDFDRFSELHVRARQIGDRAFWAVAGGAAIREVLRRVDLETLADELRAEAAARPDGEERRALVDRLGMVELFRERSRSGELRRRTELTVMDALPVVPRHERDSGSEYAVRCARAAHRCARLRKMMTHQAPDVILRNERRMVQEAVDAVLDEVHRWRHSEVTDAS
jgi:DNA-directed RNA polymerase subunit beta'